MILPCQCKHEFQDKVHGRGRRVHNVLRGDSKARCTACGSVKELSKEQITRLKHNE